MEIMESIKIIVITTDGLNDGAAKELGKMAIITMKNVGIKILILGIATTDPIGIGCKPEIGNISIGEMDEITKNVATIRTGKIIVSKTAYGHFTIEIIITTAVASVITAVVMAFSEITAVDSAVTAVAIIISTEINGDRDVAGKEEIRTKNVGTPTRTLGTAITAYCGLNRVEITSTGIRDEITNRVATTGTEIVGTDLITADGLSIVIIIKKFCQFFRLLLTYLLICKWDFCFCISVIDNTRNGLTN